MRKLLQINSSLNRDESISNRLSDECVACYLQKYPKTEVIKRDIAVDPISHLDSEAVYAFFNPDADLTERQRRSLVLSNTLIQELKDADILVFGLPFYNFGIPSTLKAWIDHVVRARMTFRYTGEGESEGLLKGKKAFLLASRCGFYAGMEKDVQTKYITNILDFIGITDINFVYAEGMASGTPGQIQEALDAAYAKIKGLVEAS